MYASICESVYYDFSGMLFSCSNTQLTSAVNPDMQTLYAGGRTREDPKSTKKENSSWKGNSVVVPRFDSVKSAGRN